ncbi:phosphate-regulating neutral endopeptidase PHEX [Drosophila nasuta]|uniref:phosphate-regulating neutral endopeptidase PHEX n=1 Tax=Drosophila nasuta TaxID=42062 RepID=UPI00295F0468|nr:phosphate-regulating neutral endopeptidase PHEX [Drosophila nasuta]
MTISLRPKSKIDASLDLSLVFSRHLNVTYHNTQRSTDTMKLLLTTCLLASLTLSWSATHPYPYVNTFERDILRLAKAAHIKAYMSEGEPQPCDNFYNFACGNWPRLHPSKLYNKRTNYLDELQELFVRKSADMLKAATSNSDSSADRLIKNFYNTCNAEANNTSSALSTLLEVTDFRGGWPEIRVPSWYSYEYDWLLVVANLKRKLGVDILIGLEVVPDYKEEHLHRLKVGAPKLPLGHRRQYMDAAYYGTRVRYERNIAEKLHNYFPDQSELWCNEVASQILEIEQQLAKGLPHNAALTMEQTTRERTPFELKAAYGSFVDVSRYLQQIFNDSLYATLYETPEDYLSNLMDVIRTTPKLHLANYTIWRALDTFDQARIPSGVQPSIWCVQMVRKYFPQQLENLFHRNYNNMQMINELQSTWTDIRRVFREDLQASPNLHWLSLDTRQKAINKLDKLELKFRTHDESELIRQLYGLRVNEGHFYPNLVNVLQWSTKRQLAKLVEEPQLTDKVYKLPHYELETNKMQIPITFLQARFFWDSNYPQALKFGTLGVLLARQMLHGFDDVGRRYDRNGYRNNWWDSTSETSFAERAQCFQEQYAVFVQFQEKPVTDKGLQSRVVADNGALSIAYRAYIQWLNNSPESGIDYRGERLPLLDHTPHQLFFLAYGQLYCNDYPDTLEAFDEIPEQLRVNTALSNSEKFIEAFSCPVGAKLNARFKCQMF